MDFRNRVDYLLKVAIPTFGEWVTAYPKCGGVYKLKGVFDNDFQVVDVQTEQLVSANQPAIGLNLNDVKWNLAVGDEFEIRAAKYRVAEKKEDGQGGVTCLLHAMKVKDASRDTRAPKT